MVVVVVDLELILNDGPQIILCLVKIQKNAILPVICETYIEIW